MDSYFQIEGKMLVACFGEGKVNGQPVQFFMDLNGPDFENNIIGTLVYAPKQTFDAWDGILFPLMLNGYVKDKAMFDDISVFKIDDLARAATFYGAMVDTKLYSEFAALTTLTEEANKALRNGTTISNCLLSDNCDITYNANGEAEPNYTNN